MNTRLLKIVPRKKSKRLREREEVFARDDGELLGIIIDYAKNPDLVSVGYEFLTRAFGIEPNYSRDYKVLVKEIEKDLLAKRQKEFAGHPGYAKRSASANTSHRKVATELMGLASSLLADSKVAVRKFVLKELYLDDTPSVVAKGTLPQLNAWAKKKGYLFRKDNSLFGGYWAGPKGESFIFDIA